MTDEEINDAVIMKMGWIRNTDKEIYGGYLSGYKPLNGRFPPNFCKSIDAAWECMEKMAGIDEPWGLFEPYVFRDKLGDSCWVAGVKSSCGWVVREIADTAPKAICLAFLKLP